MTTAPTCHLVTLGCKVNQYETQYVKEALELNGYREAGPEAAKVGIALGRELIAGARELAAGVYVVAPFRRPLGVLEVLAA